MSDFWDVLSTVVTIISIFIAVFEVVRFLGEKWTIISIPLIGRCFSWRKINSIVKKICTKIKEAPEPFASIVGIGRGGAIFSALMSYQLDAIPILAIDRKYSVDDGKKTVVLTTENVILGSDFKDLLEKPVLLVSQRSDPGTTILEYKKFLEEIGFKKIYVCAVLFSENSTFVDITYYYKKYNHSKTTKSFPWLYKKPNIMIDKKYFLHRRDTVK